MNYPLISEYIDAILNAEDNFDTLCDLRPVLGEDGRPFMSSGNFAVVFKMTDGRNNYAVKCFTKEQEGREENYRLITQKLECVNSKYLLSVEYLEDELFVDTQQSEKDTFPVLKMQWAEGVTLDRYINAHLSDDYALQMLAYEFNRMGMWLMNQDFAHGDLKPDNILVRNDGTLVLVDYDGMFVPAMQGQKASELGTPDFRHPLRTVEWFDARIDDFAIAAIALSLKAIVAKPSLWADYHSQDRLLLRSSDYVLPGDSPLLRELLSLSNDTILSRLFGLFMIALSSQKLSLTSFRLLEVSKPEHKKLEILPTKVSKEDIANGIEDEFGVVYSRDGKRLLECKNKDITQYNVKEGTVSICDLAFLSSVYLTAINIPDSVTGIGQYAFDGCFALTNTNISSSVTSIGNNAFSCCDSLTHIRIPASVAYIGNDIFSGCDGLISIVVDKNNPVYDSRNSNIIVETKSNTLICGCQKSILPNSITSIGDSAFSSCKSLTSINIPNSVINIGDGAFTGCESLSSITIPNSVTSIGNYAFSYCESLESIDIPNSVRSIGGRTFAQCKSLKTINIPNSVTVIGGYAFSGCKSLKSVYIPNSVTSIGKAAFCGCKSLKSVYIPNSVTSIEEYTFWRCESLESINMPNTVTNIGKAAFCGCKSLESINMPNTVTNIGKAAFCGCKSLKSIVIPNSVTYIGDAALHGCTSLKSINIPASVENIGKGVLVHCSQLRSIVVDKLNPIYDSRDCNIIVETKLDTLICGCQKSIIPNSITSIGDNAFEGCHSLTSINIPNSVKSIGHLAFCLCHSLESINLPNSVTSIINTVFSNCHSLKYINIPIDTRSKFERLLPDYKQLFVEI